MNASDWNPGKLMELSGYYWKTCTLHAGVKLDIFTIIGSRKLSGKAVAEKMNADQRAVTTLLNALSAMQLLEKSDDYYANTEGAKTFLSKDSRQYIGYMIMHHYHLMESWIKIDQAVLSGKPVRKRSSNQEEDQRESFLMGMFNMAMSIAPKLSDSIDLSSRSHLLDLGGGPGTYAIHYCLKNPNLKAKIFDMPTTRPFAEKTVDKFGLRDRIEFIPGDYLSDPIPGSYDVAWLSHILHGEGTDDCQQIINKTVAAMKPGGMILIHEFILDNTMDKPLFPALFSINMLIGTSKGQSYSEKQLMDMLKKAGVKEVKRLDFKGPTESGIISGIV
jgi:ubiquinone/menaquinone biosynthesis C-methylase UbiE